jgi:phosphate butyryltransferase
VLFRSDPVAGRADLLIAPDIVSGNVIYKSWIATIGGTVANVVPGAQVPLIISSRSDTDRSKFLTICSSVLFSRYIESTRTEQP